MKPNHKLTNVLKGRSIESVDQEDTTLVLHLNDNSTVQITLGEPTSSVMVRSGESKLEYAD